LISACPYLSTFNGASAGCEFSSLAGVDGTVISVGGLAVFHFGWSQASLDGERLLGVLPEAAAIAVFAMTYLVVAAARPVGGIARPALDKPPAPVAPSLFLLFYLVEIRHRQLLRSRSRTR
jgi:hypothetical protein